MWKFSVAASLLLALLVYAGEKPPEACKLLTATDVEKVVGKGYALSPFRGTASDNSNCGYIKDKANVANLMIVDGGMPDISEGFKQMQEHYSKTASKLIPFEGAGKGAFYIESINVMTKEPIGVVHFGKGRWHGVMDVRRDGKPNPDAEQKLAKTAFARLP